MADANPFANLLQTPENIRYERQARFDAENAGSDFWTRLSGQSGLDLRNRLIEQGRGMNSQDRRAAATQAILGNAQKTMAQYVESGELDPMDAQELAVSQAMTDFMAVGDYASAQSLLPSLNGIRDYKAQIGKLRSETAENQADAYASEAKGDRENADRFVTLKKLPYETGKLDAEAGYNRAGSVQRLADARLKDRLPAPAAGGGASGSARKILPSHQAKLTQGFSATMGVFDSLHELSLHMEQLPAVASAGGAAYNVGAQWLAGAYNFLSQRGTVESNVQDRLTDEQKQIAKTGAAQRASNARSMGMKNVTAYNSSVIDTAYAMARAMDPGGRLSNNDFAFALQALGAVQDADSAKAAFAAIAERAYMRHKNTVKAEGTEAMKELFPEALENIDATYAEFNKRWGRANVRDVDDAQAPAKVPCTPGRKKYGLC